MPKGTPREWTLDELQTIWNFDGDGGQTTITDAARGLGVSHSHWYGIRARLQTAGSPEALLAEMNEAKRHRYNRTSDGRVRAGTRELDTIENALTRVYVIRVGGAGRGGNYEQFSVTIPPFIARAFTARYGLEVTYEVREEGILIKPAPRVQLPDELPSWLEPSRGAQAKPSTAKESPAAPPDREGDQ